MRCHRFGCQRSGRCRARRAGRLRRGVASLRRGLRPFARSAGIQSGIQMPHSIILPCVERAHESEPSGCVEAMKTHRRSSSSVQFRNCTPPNAEAVALSTSAPTGGTGGVLVAPGHTGWPRVRPPRPREHADRARARPLDAPARGPGRPVRTVGSEEEASQCISAPFGGWSKNRITIRTVLKNGLKSPNGEGACGYSFPEARASHLSARRSDSATASADPHAS